mgnify:CR=1 FL=1
MEMYFIKIENLTDYECSDFVAHFNNYEVAQKFLEECIEDYRSEDVLDDEHLISYGKSHWDNGILVDNWLEAKTIII